LIVAAFDFLAGAATVAFVRDGPKSPAADLGGRRWGIAAAVSRVLPPIPSFILSIHRFESIAIVRPVPEHTVAA